MKTVLKVIRKIVDWACILLLAAITVLVLAQVICRYLLHNPLTWSEELCRYMQVAMVMLGASILMRDNGHLAIDVIVASMKPKLRYIVDIFVKIVTIAFFALIAYYGIGATKNAGRQTSAAMILNMRYVYMFLPIGGTLCCLEGVIELVDYITHKNPFQKKEIPSVEAE